MTVHYSPEELVERVPAFLDSLWRVDSRDSQELLATLNASGLQVSDPQAVEDAARRLPRYRLPILGDAGPGFERKLRSAITRRIGKPSGADKHWDVGSHVASISCRRSDEISIHLQPQFSLRELRAAASAWLGSAGLDTWLIDYRLKSPDAMASPRVILGFANAHVYKTDSGAVSVSMFMNAGARAPGTKPKDDDENLASTLAFLAEGLGENPAPGRWTRGTRSFVIRRMRSRARSIDFRENWADDRA